MTDSPKQTTPVPERQEMVARVVANFGATVAIRHDDDVDDRGEIDQASPRRHLPLLVAGDRVRCERDEAGSYRVIDLLPRRSVLERADHRGKAKALAANLSHLAIVSAKPPGIDTLLIDEFCVGAARAGIGALIVINKADLLTEEERAGAEATLAVYRQVGHVAVLIDAKSDGGLEPLRVELVGRTIALVGASGVGKSSIVNQLIPDLDVRIGAISTATGLGSHTTSVTFHYALPGGGSVVDSPGVRRYAVIDAATAEVQAGYREISELSNQCRFGNCSHVVEPGCAVRAAVEAGEVASWRFANYRKLAGL